MNLLALVLKDLRAQHRRMFLSATGIGLGVFILFLTLSLGLGVRQAVLEKLVQELPVTMIEVQAGSVDLGLFKIGKAALFGGKSLDESVVQQFAEAPGHGV